MYPVAPEHYEPKIESLWVILEDQSASNYTRKKTEDMSSIVYS